MTIAAVITLATALILNTLGQGGVPASPIGGQGGWVLTLNTAANLFSVYLLIKASNAYRREVAPSVQRVEAKVEDVAQAVMPAPWDGKDRRDC